MYMYIPSSKLAQDLGVHGGGECVIQISLCHTRTMLTCNRSTCTIAAQIQCTCTVHVHVYMYKKITSRVLPLGSNARLDWQSDSAIWVFEKSRYFSLYSYTIILNNHTCSNTYTESTTVLSDYMLLFAIDCQQISCILFITHRSVTLCV